MRKSHKIRPVLESLESIELLSTMPGHAAGHIAHHALSQQAAPSFQAIFPTNYAVTGVRQDTGGNVAITLAAKLPSGATQAYVYYGPLSSISNPSFLHEFSPTIPGVTSVTSSALYGPNTPMFNPSSIPANNITAVGSYVAAGSSYQYGMVYKGPVDGTGTYTPFVAPGNGKDTVGDTIAHSTMGNLIVGNFDYQSDPKRGHGFIYDTSSGQPPNAENFTTVDRGRFSTTIYGIWQNGGGSSTSYTIVGGFSNVANGGRAFIENYTPGAKMHRFRDFKSFSFNNRPSVDTHFEGISVVTGGFSVAATETSLRTKTVGASYAFIPVSKHRAFGKATWVPIPSPGSPTTGNTVIDSSVMGVFPLDDGDFSSYISTV